MNVIILDLGNDIKGESSVPGFEKKIELLSFTLGDAIRRDSQDMVVTKYLDTVTPHLHQAAVEGKAFPQVDIIVGRKDAGGVSVLLRYTMKNVLIFSVSIQGGGGDKPVETLTLHYNSISWEFSRPEM